MTKEIIKKHAKTIGGSVLWTVAGICIIGAGTALGMKIVPISWRVTWSTDELKAIGKVLAEGAKEVV